MQTRATRFRLLKHFDGTSISTNRFVSEIASQTTQPSHEQQHNSVQIKSTDKVKKEWIRFSSYNNPVLDHRISAAPSIDVGSLILFEDNHLLVLLKPNMALVQGDLGGASNLLDSAKDFLAQRDKKRGEAFLGTPDEGNYKWYPN